MLRQTRFISTYAKSRLDAFDRLSQTLPILEPIQLKGIKTDQGIPTERIKPATGYDHQTFWHSSSHVLGYALESHFGDRVLLTDGPATKQGFFYDALVFDSSQFLTNRLSEIKSNASVLFEKDRIAQDIHDLMHGEFGRIHFVTAQELMKLEIICGKIAKKNLSISYLNISKRDALDMFALSPFKLQTIVSLPTNQEITVYKMGDFVDLCKGPHIANTRIIKSFWIDRTSGVQHTPDLPPSLSRINGISFPTTKDMKDHKEYLVEIEKRNHRSIGARQKLFQFHDYSPGAPFMLPHGMKIVNKLKSLLVGMYKRMGFEEVATPLIFDKKLWETSGHWSEYRENMFGVRGCCAQDDQERGLKPMNCPAHCLIYSSQTRSIRDLPLRLAEFSALHRNEASGALSGLTRVRQFHQDDGHIFTPPSLIQQEIKTQLEYMAQVYKLFHLDFEVALSTRPETFLGTMEEWDEAEFALKTALQEFCDIHDKPLNVKEGDGAFYGPKIDIGVKDRMGRTHQTGTLQLDFQLPQRFGLVYTGSMDDSKSTNGENKPVMIHRAFLGSIERFFAILCEHTSGKWPFWLSPRQVIIITTRDDPEINSYAKKVLKHLTDDTSPDYALNWLDKHGFEVEVDLSDKTLGNKVRIARELGFHSVVIIGDEEFSSETVTLRHLYMDSNTMKFGYQDLPTVLSDLERSSLKA